jgi:hypothetical protein
MIHYVIETSRPDRREWTRISTAIFESVAWNVVRDLRKTYAGHADPPLFRVVREERTVLHPPEVHPGRIATETHHAILH